MKSLHNWLVISLFIPLMTNANVVSLQKGINFQTPDNITEYFVSEKLDGVRAYWDGNNLVTRSGKKIHVPQWFVSKWPETPLDGELWSKRGDFQNIVSCIRRLPKNQQDCWQNIRFHVFDLPAEQDRFEQRFNKYNKLIQQIDSPTLIAIPQSRVGNIRQLNALLQQIVTNGAEGLMLHHQDAYYQNGRNAKLMKYKQYFDAEAQVVKHIAGKGKYTGKMGAILVQLPDGQQFKIGTGFSDHERNNPPPVGSIVTYRYIGKTDRGIPKFASYLRIRQTE